MVDEGGAGPDVAVQQQGEPWQVGEARHEGEYVRLQAAGTTANRRGRFSDSLQERLKKKRELARQLEYPEYDPNFDDPEWMKEQLRKEYEDPRENPNFFLSPEDPEYWHNVARKPYAKAILRSQEHGNMRKAKWKAQQDSVERMNTLREEIAAELEECSPEVKRMVTPVMRYKIIDIYLFHIHDEAQRLGLTFAEMMENEEARATLAYFRTRLDARGEAAAAELLHEFDTRLVEVDATLKDKEEKEKKQQEALHDSSDAKALADALNWGHKCKKDGLLEWNEGNHSEALKSWREGSGTLRPLRASLQPGAVELRELYVALLKNQAQAAIMVGNLQEALEAASDALEIDDQDHKAWFRKACALEGLGRLSEVEECLNMIDSIAVGRPDRERIGKDTQAKREKVKALLEQKAVVDKRMVQRGLQRGLFSCERDRQVEPPPPPKLPAPRQSAGFDGKLLDATRKRLTRDGAEELLRALRKAYSDTGFRKQVTKLAHDVDFDKEAFLAYLSRVALPVQGPVLQRWGFEDSERGVVEMTRAIQDHTRGSRPDAKLRELAEQTLKVLYGDMYEAVHEPSLPEDARQHPRVQMVPRHDGESGTESDS